MSEIFGVTQAKQKQIYNASKQQQPASDVSVWNKEGANGTEQKTLEELPQYRSDMTAEEIYNQFIKEMAVAFKKFGATEENITELFDILGYKKEKCLSLTKDELSDAQIKLTGIIEGIYGSGGNPEQRRKDVIALSKYNDIEGLNEYLENNGSQSFVYIVKRYAGSDKVKLADEIRTKWKNIESINDLSPDELKGIIMMLVRNECDLGINAEQLICNIFINLPEEVLKANSELCIELYNVLKQVNKDKMVPGVYLLMIDKLKNSSEDLKELLSRERIDDIFKMFNNPEEVNKFFIKAQSIINSGSAEDKAVLANSVSEYLTTMLVEVSKINTKADKSPEDIKFIETYERLKELYAAATGYANACGDDSHVKDLNNAPMSDEFKRASFKQTYEFSLSAGLDLDPVKIKERLDEFTDNEYSRMLQTLGYELPTAENLDSLREKAANGTLIPSKEEGETIGYTQSAAQSDVDYAAGRAEYLLSYINNNQQQETYTIDGKVEDNVTEKSDEKAVKSVNTANLGMFSGRVLKKMVDDGVIPFINAVKEYSRTLSESGKDYVVNTIKQKDDGERSYILNQASFTASYEIMDKANLLDNEELKRTVKLDSIHEQLRDMA